MTEPYFIAAPEDPLESKLLRSSRLMRGEARPGNTGVTRRVEQANALGEVVYYMRRGDHIKIGYSNAVGNRTRGQGGMDNLLAIEFGGRDLEHARHLQFAEHLVPGQGREVFYPAAVLTEHIQSLRTDLGLPRLRKVA